VRAVEADGIKSVEGGAGDGFCRYCGMRVVWAWIEQGPDMGVVHKDLSDAAIMERAIRGCSWHPELAEGGAAIWEER